MDSKLSHISRRINISRMSRRTLLVGSLAAISFGSSNLHASTVTAFPLGLTVKTPNGPVPAYVPVIVPIDTKISGNGIFQLPGYLVVKLFQVATGEFGAVVGGAYSAEGERRYLARLAVPAGMGTENYTAVRVKTVHDSVSGANFEQWAGLGTAEATFRWGLEKKDFFRGNSWFGAVAISLMRHNDWPQNASEADAVFQSVVASVEDEVRKAQAARQAQDNARKDYRGKPDKFLK